jgi:flagellin
MTSISSLPNVASTQLQASKNINSRVQAAIAKLVGLPGLFPNTDSISSLSTAAQLQAQNAEIRQASGNIVQALSLSQVADSGASQIQSTLGQLQSLAQQASSGALNDDNRAQLDAQFQQLVQQLNSLARGSNFNGRSLLDGTLSGDGAISLEQVIAGEGDASAADLSIADLTSNGLFNGQNLNILSSGSAASALSAINSAVEQVAGVRATIGSFQQVLDVAAANVDSVLANQLASQSVLESADFSSPSSDVQQNALNAVAAQTNQLSPQLLQLVA